MLIYLRISSDDYPLQKRDVKSRVINILNSNNEPLEATVISVDNNKEIYEVYGFLRFNRIKNKAIILQAKGYITDTIHADQIVGDTIFLEKNNN